MNEQQLIERYFMHNTIANSNVAVGIGDDAAILTQDPLRASSEERLVLTADTLVEGRHFNPDTDAGDIGHKALATSLSDLAAMGASPSWALLCLSLPGDGIEDWIAGFSEGFLALARRWEVNLLGGDLVRGPRVVTVQLGGAVNATRTLLRSGARVGDGIYLSGAVGDASLAWRHLGEAPLPAEIAALCASRLNRPEPRVKEGQIIAQFASSAIDVSDGLLLDLFRLTEASGVAAQLEVDRVPLGEASRRLCGKPEDWVLPLTGGDDYELLFSMDDRHCPMLDQTLAGEPGCATVTRIGRVSSHDNEGGERLRCTFEKAPWPLPERLGFDHFGD